MKTLILSALLAMPAAAATEAPAAKPAASAWTGVRQWLQNLREGLSDSAVASHQRRMRGSVAVAAVRGAGQTVEDPNKPYWKNASEARRAAALKKERAELAAAVDLALAGKNAESLAAFDAFEKNHPKSQLLDDCRQAREKVKAAAAEAKTEPAAPASEKR